MDSTPIFNYMFDIDTYKGFISYSYTMLLNLFHRDFPLKVVERWERDVGAFEEEQWEEALQAVPLCSLNVAQRVSQLYILLRVHYTPARLARMGVRADADCTRCSRDHGDLIHLLWRCPKLHLYWSQVLDTLTRVFQTTIPADPKHCLLGILDALPLEDVCKHLWRGLSSRPES